MAPPQLSAAPPQLNVLQHHYPMQGPRGALPVSLQPAAPYAMPPQVPVHLHPAVPLLQVPAVGAQGLPPPPPPPPPMQQGGQMVAAQPDGYMTQVRLTATHSRQSKEMWRNHKKIKIKRTEATAPDDQPLPTAIKLEKLTLAQ